MTTHDTIDHFCPMCGYNRRGAATDRCSECGARVGRGIVSRLPWMQRRWRGSFTAFWQTAWLVLRHPAFLARELPARLPRRDGRRFARIALFLTAVLGTCLLTIAFLCLGKAWNDLAPEPFNTQFGMRLNPQLSGFAPMFVLWDNPLILLPAALTLYCGWALNVRVFQFLLRVCARPDIPRRRTLRLAQYFAAIPLWATMVLGVMAILEAISLEHDDLVASIAPAQWVLLLLLAVVLLVPAINFTLRTTSPGTGWWTGYAALGGWTALIIGAMFVEILYSGESFHGNRYIECVGSLLGYTLVTCFLSLITAPALWKIRWHVLRVAYVVAVYPLLATLTFCVTALIVFWTCGFLAICVGSMFR